MSGNRRARSPILVRGRRIDVADAADTLRVLTLRGDLDEAWIRDPARQGAQSVDRLRTQGARASRPEGAPPLLRRDGATDGGSGDGQPRTAAPGHRSLHAAVVAPGA